MSGPLESILYGLLSNIATKWIGKLCKKIMSNIKSSFTKNKTQTDNIINSLSKTDSVSFDLTQEMYEYDVEKATEINQFVDDSSIDIMGTDENDTDVMPIANKEQYNDTSKASVQNRVSSNVYMNISDQLANFVYTLESDMDKTESEIIELTRKYFIDFTDEIKNNGELRKNGMDLPSSLSMLPLEIEKTIKGSMKKYIAKHITLDNNECRNIFEIIDIDEKQERLNKLRKSTITKGLNIVESKITKTIKMRLSDLNLQVVNNCERKNTLIAAIETEINYLKETHTVEQKQNYAKMVSIKQTIDLCNDLIKKLGAIV